MQTSAANEEYISKLAQVVNENLDSKIKSRLGAIPKPDFDIQFNEFGLKLESQQRTLQNTIRDLQSVLEEAKTELDEIKRIKALLISDIISSPETVEVTTSTLLENVERQRKEFLKRLEEKEARWQLDEKRIQQERAEYEKSKIKLSPSQLFFSKNL